MASDGRILFVYNADSGVIAQLKDYVHKIVSPQTYPCSLCQITFGNLGMKPAWRRFVQELPLTAVFLHRDELTGRHSSLLAEKLPAVYVEAGEEITLLLSADELNEAPDVPALQALVLARLGEGASVAPLA